MYVLKVSDKFSIVYSGPEMRGGRNYCYIVGKV